MLTNECAYEILKFLGYIGMLTPVQRIWERHFHYRDFVIVIADSEFFFIFIMFVRHLNLLHVSIWYLLYVYVFVSSLFTFI